MAEKYFVYYGHTTPDNYKGSPNHLLQEYDSVEQVCDLRLKWTNPENFSHEECQNCYFQVVRGRRQEMRPKQIVDTWELIDE